MDNLAQFELHSGAVCAVAAIIEIILYVFSWFGEKNAKHYNFGSSEGKAILLQRLTLSGDYLRILVYSSLFALIVLPLSVLLFQGFMRSRSFIGVLLMLLLLAMLVACFALIVREASFAHSIGYSLIASVLGSLFGLLLLLSLLGFITALVSGEFMGVGVSIAIVAITVAAFVFAYRILDKGAQGSGEGELKLALADCPEGELEGVFEAYREMAVDSRHFTPSSSARIAWPLSGTKRPLFVFVGTVMALSLFLVAVPVGFDYVADHPAVTVVEDYDDGKGNDFSLVENSYSVFLGQVKAKWYYGKDDLAETMARDYDILGLKAEERRDRDGVMVGGSIRASGPDGVPLDEDVIYCMDEIEFGGANRYEVLDWDGVVVRTVERLKDGGWKLVFGSIGDEVESDSALVVIYDHERNPINVENAGEPIVTGTWLEGSGLERYKLHASGD